MSEITISLPDGSRKSLPAGATIRDVAEAIGPRLASAAIAGRIDGQLVDVTAPVPDGALVEIMTERDFSALNLLRHSAAHVMAEAVQDLFPDVKFGIGPAIEDGFYYDFDVPRPLRPRS